MPTNNLPVEVDDSSVQDVKEPTTDSGSAHAEDNPIEAVLEDEVIPVNGYPDDSSANTAPITVRVEEPEIVSDSPRPHANGEDTVTPRHKVDEQTHTEHTNTSPFRTGFPMPISADPTVPDPTSRPNTPPRPLILSMPGTPTFLLSPADTPGSGRPTPVSVPVPASILKALQLQQSQSRMTMSGLFTPGAATASGPGTPDGLSGESLQGEDDVVVPRREAEHEDQLLAEELTVNGKGAHVASQVETSEHVFDDVKMGSSYPPAVAAGVPVESVPYPKPSLRLGSPTISYPMNVVLTRKPTDPILYSDPYPYSLSTPGSDFLDPTKDGHDELSEEENELDNSISSSSTTLDKELEDKDVENQLGNLSNDNLEDDAEDLELWYPSDSDTRNDVSTKKGNSNFVVPQVAQPPAESGLVGGEDTGADGDMDPDFVEPDISVSEALHQHPDFVAQTEEDPFKLMGNDSTVAPSAVEDDGSSSDSKNEAEMAADRPPDDEP